MVKALMAALAAVALVGCSAPSIRSQPASPAGHLSFEQLRSRTLHASTVAPGSHCPTSKLARISFGQNWVLANGTWPFYFGPYGWPIGAGDFSKTPWNVAPGYKGRLVVRGKQLDTPASLAFGFWPIGYGTLAASPGLPILFTRLDAMERAVVYQGELDVDAPAGGQADGHYWSFPSAGCYLVQTDGDSFSNRTIVYVTNL